MDMQNAHMPEANIPPAPLRLKKTKGTRVSRELLLEADDHVIAVNGVPWEEIHSIHEMVKTIVEGDNTPALLGIWRAGQTFEVLTTIPLECPTEAVSGENLPQPGAHNSSISAGETSGLSQFVIYADGVNSADVVEFRDSFLAMICPPLWLVARRFWEAVVASVSLVLTAFVVNPWFGVGVYLALCLFVGRKQKQIVKFAMSREGMRRVMVLAARDEVTAQHIALAFHPKLKFRFPNHERSDASEMVAKKAGRKFPA
jgi:hypothetical protein